MGWQQPECSRYAWRALLPGALLLAPALIYAAPVNSPRIENLALDSARSHAEFDVRAMWVFSVRGRFGAVRGTISIDRFRSTAAVDAQIDADAVSMRNPDYEAWVKSAEFFDVEHYPNIHFVSEPITLERMNHGGEITGVLTVRGVSHAVTFTLRPSACPGAAVHGCAAEAEGTIRRSDFGMRSHRISLSDRVDLHFAIFATASADAQDRAP